MSLTPAAKRRIDDAAAEVIGAQKDAYREKIVAIQAAFRPKLTNAELAAGLGLKAPAPGATGQSDIGRFVSTSPRNRRARPDAWARTLIDALLAGTLLIAVREEGELDARREIVVCEPADVSWLGAGWSVKNLAGGEVPETRSAAANWDAETMWDLFDETPAAAEQPPSVSVADADVGPVQLASLALSAIGLGGMRLSTAGRPDEALGIRLLHQAWGMGLTFVDTADAYCQDDTDVGHNERLIAKALASWSGPREQIVIATKGGLIRPGGRWIPSGHPTHLRAAAEASAKALGVDSVVEDSSGNAGAAIAAYCARAGICCDVYVPDTTSPTKLEQIQSYGADLHLIPGTREKTAEAALKAAENRFYASHVWNPYFFHGTKTFAEISVARPSRVSSLHYI